MIIIILLCPELTISNMYLDDFQNQKILIF
jgi:hypothetical protein